MSTQTYTWEEKNPGHFSQKTGQGGCYERSGWWPGASRVCTRTAPQKAVANYKRPNWRLSSQIHGTHTHSETHEVPRELFCPRRGVQMGLGRSLQPPLETFHRPITETSMPARVSWTWVGKHHRMICCRRILGPSKPSNVSK